MCLPVCLWGDLCTGIQVPEEARKGYLIPGPLQERCTLLTTVPALKSQMSEFLPMVKFPLSMTLSSYFKSINLINKLQNYKSFFDFFCHGLRNQCQLWGPGELILFHEPLTCSSLHLPQLDRGSSQAGGWRGRIIWWAQEVCTCARTQEVCNCTKGTWEVYST